MLYEVITESEFYRVIPEDWNRDRLQVAGEDAGDRIGTSPGGEKRAGQGDGERSTPHHSAVVGDSWNP